MSVNSAATAPNPQGRPARPQHLLEVVRCERLTPHLVRVHFGGAGFSGFIAAADAERIAKTDKYVKFLFAKPELGLTPPFDLEELRTRLPLEDLPVRRTYTVRSIDEAAQTFAIDFVVHGDEGVAGPWAANAKPGDLVSLAGPGGQYIPAADPALPRLLLGDDSALPAIAAALEAMPDQATGVALIEVGGPSDEIDIAHPAGIEVRWLHRDGAAGIDPAPSETPAEHGSLLVSAVRKMERPETLPEVFAHGERGAMKELRQILHNAWGIERRALSLSAYWAIGRAEDGFQAEKREAVGQIFPEA